MKKIVLIAAILLSSNLISAQNNNISLGYGYASIDQIGYTFSILFGSLFLNLFADDNNYERASFFGPIALSYHHTLDANKRFSYGGSAVFENAIFENNTSNKKISYNAITFAPEGKFKYLNPDNPFNLYGLVGAGLTIFNTSTEESTVHFNFQLSPIGLEYGNNVKAFIELGLGYKGIISGGVTYRF